MSVLCDVYIQSQLRTQENLMITVSLHVQGEELDPDSKTTWYTWHDKQMAKIRNEQLVITDHWQNAFRSIIWNLLTNGLLAVAAISQIRSNADVLFITELQNEEE